ncbi:MAG: DUF362 domain-containing protein [Candidatus Ozemobacteraceae bacterium]
MNRRTFLKWLAGGAGALVFGTGIGRLLRQNCPVTILPLADAGRVDLVSDIMRTMTEDGLVLRDKSVLLKPNFVEYHENRPINTDISLLRQVSEACLKLGAREVIVGEAAGHRRDPGYSIFNPHVRANLDRRVILRDLNHGDVVALANRGKYTRLSKLYVAAPVAQANVFINMPKLKTHHWMGVTLSLKNLFGTMPGIIYGWPKNVLHVEGIDRSILDLARSIRVDYVIADGIVGMEGDGPIMGTARPLGMIAMGKHPLAIDATCARIMGFDPYELEYLGKASWFLPGLAADSIIHRGEHPKRFATKFACLPNFSFAQTGPFW